MQQVTIMDFVFKTLVFFGTVTIGSTDLETSRVCATPQYLDLGIIGTIQCSFRENSYGVYWYSSTDSANTYPLLTFQESEKGGDGYLSGEFDVFPNGSLIIKNVSLRDDHIFRVILLDSKDVDSVIHDIRVYVTVRSKQPHPYINICGEEPVCLVELQEPLAVECSVAGTRPAVNLTWTVQHETTYWKVLYESEISSHDNLFTTNVKMTVSFENSYLIQHFVCTAVDPPGILAGTESRLFLENANEHVSLGNPVAEHVKHGTKLTLSCLVKGSMFVIWKRLSNDKWETLAHTVFGEKVYLKTYADDYLLDKSGSLVIPHAVISHEGLYMCVFSTSRNNSVKIIDVVVFVPPEPPSLIIVGCLPDESCILTVQEEGNITCTVRGVRPKIKLGWFTFPDVFSEYISFSTHEEITEKVGDKYDVTLISQYKLMDASQKSLAVECRASGWDKDFSSLDKTVVLHFIDDQTTKELGGSGLNAVFVVIPCALVIVLVLLALVITHRRKKACKNSKDNGNTEERDQLNPNGEPDTQDMNKESADNEIKLKTVKDTSKIDDCTSTGERTAYEERRKSFHKDPTTFQKFPNLSGEILTFSNKDDKLCQMSNEQLDNAVTKCKNEIKQLIIKDCMSSSAFLNDFLVLKNGFQIPVLQYLEKLEIHWTGHEMDDEQLQWILQYATSCEKLRELRFLDCVFKSFENTFPKEVVDRNFSVVWVSGYFAPMKLHLQTGKWVEKDGDGQITLDEFEELKQKVKEKYKT